jgi:hypothetical protein
VRERIGGKSPGETRFSFHLWLGGGQGRYGGEVWGSGSLDSIAHWCHRRATLWRESGPSSIKRSPVIELWSHDKARAHKGGVRIGKTPKKLVSICCPQRRETKAGTLKQLRTIGEADQELEKRLDQEELT